VHTRFSWPQSLALDERGRLLVTEGRKDILRVVEASLAPPLWMEPKLPWYLERVLWIGVLKGGKDCLLSRLALDGSRTSGLLLKIIELVSAQIAAALWQGPQRPWPLGLFVESVFFVLPSQFFDASFLDDSVELTLVRGLQPPYLIRC